MNGKVWTFTFKEDVLAVSNDVPKCSYRNVSVGLTVFKIIGKHLALAVMMRRSVMIGRVWPQIGKENIRHLENEDVMESFVKHLHN